MDAEASEAAEGSYNQSMQLVKLMLTQESLCDERDARQEMLQRSCLTVANQISKLNQPNMLSSQLERLTERLRLRTLHRDHGAQQYQGLIAAGERKIRDSFARGASPGTHPGGQACVRARGSHRGQEAMQDVA